LVSGVLAQEPSLAEIRENLDLYLKRWAEEYVSYIITDEERKVFSGLPTQSEKLAFIESFWRRRDPTPQTPENELREQYAARFAYATRQFRTALPGWKTDRGRMYILLGPPTYIDRNPTGRISTERPSEVWTYMGLNHPDLPSSLELNFVDFFGTGDLEIVSDLNSAEVLPSGFAPAYSDLEYYGLRRSHPVEYADEGVARSLDEGDLASDRFNFLQDLRSAESPDIVRQKPLGTLVEADATFTALPFELTVQTFSSRIAGALEVRYGDLAVREGFSLDVFAELRSGDADAPEVIDRLDRQLNFELTPEERTSDALRYLFALSAPPGSYRLYFAVRDNFRESLGTREATVVVPAQAEGLALSSLVLADSVEPLPSAPDEQGPFTFGNVNVVPNPTHRFQRGEPMHVYFQAYGLSAPDGQNSAKVHYMFSGDGRALWKPTEVTLPPTANRERAIYSSFDTSRFPAGAYKLFVKVEDLAARRTVMSEVSFTIQ
jgi:GWxTD domain-containing protein